jgi:hypothetical protein
MSLVNLSDPAVQTGIGITAIDLIAGTASVPAYTTSLDVVITSPSSSSSAIYIASWSAPFLSSANTWTDSISILATTGGFTANFGTNSSVRQFSWARMA